MKNQPSRFVGIRHCYVVAIVVVSFTLSSVTSLAQGYLNLTDEQLVELNISALKQAVMTWKAGEMQGVTWGNVSVDGVVMTSTQLHDSLAQIVTNMPQRSVRMANPSPEQMGVFWDFQLDYASITINGSQCSVPCTFGLFANTGRVGSGLIELQKEDSSWRITRVDGLLSFLAGEVQLLGTPKGDLQKLVPARKGK